MKMVRFYRRINGPFVNVIMQHKKKEGRFGVAIKHLRNDRRHKNVFYPMKSVGVLEDTLATQCNSYNDGFVTFDDAHTDN